MRALIRIKYVCRPISDELIGYRLVAAVPNQAARKMKARKDKHGDRIFTSTDEMVPSFRAPYMIKESSDHSMIGKAEIEKFIKDLMWEGFNEWEMVGSWDIEPV